VAVDHYYCPGGFTDTGDGYYSADNFANINQCLRHGVAVMTNEKWEQLVEMVQKNFNDVSLRTEPLMIETGGVAEAQGTQDILEFETPAGHFQLVRENRPAVLEKKMHYSHRAGDTAQTEYKLSDTEFTHKLRVYKEDEFGEWEEVTLDKLGL
jgi:hypothetical protein